MPSYEFVCNDCSYASVEVVDYESRDLLGVVSCRKCYSVNLSRMFPAPAVLTASYPDGLKREGWSELREISKLKVDQAQLSGKAGASSSKKEEMKRIKKNISELAGSMEKVKERKGHQEVKYDKIGKADPNV